MIHSTTAVDMFFRALHGSGDVRRCSKSHRLGRGRRLPKYHGSGGVVSP